MNIKCLFIAVICALATACAPLTPEQWAQADKINAERQAERDKICQFPGTCFKPDRGAPRAPGPSITGG